MNKAILGFLDLFGALFERFGVDYVQLRAIVDVKLTMDNRRTRTTLGGKEQKESSWGFQRQLLIILVLSSGLSALIIFFDAPLAVYAAIASYLLVIIVMILVTDFSQVILDASDGAIVLTRPVGDRTFFTARFVHAAVYLLQLTLAGMLPSLIVTAFTHVLLAAIVLLIASLLTAALGVLFTTVLYLLIIRFASADKMQSIVNSIQIVVVFTIMGGYQIVLRMVDLQELAASAEVIPFAWWHFFLPPLWVGYVMEAVIKGAFSYVALTSAILLLAGPLAAVWAISSGLVKNFGAQLNSMDSAPQKVSAPKVKKLKRDLAELLSPIFTRTATERGIFEMVWKIIARDRKFKLRVYPSLAYFAIIGPITVFNGSGSVTSFEQFIAMTRDNDFTKFLMIYFTALIMASVSQNVVFSDQYKASWVYRIAPLAAPGEVLSGKMWALYAKFMLPVYLFLALVISYVWGVGGLVDLAFGALVGLVFQEVEMLATQNALPFSREFTKNSGGQFLVMLVLMIFIGIVGWMHWALSKTPYLVAILIPFLAGLVWFLNKEVRKLGWDKIKG